VNRHCHPFTTTKMSSDTTPQMQPLPGSWTAVINQRLWGECVTLPWSYTNQRFMESIKHRQFWSMVNGFAQYREWQYDGALFAARTSHVCGDPRLYRPHAIAYPRGLRYDDIRWLFDSFQEPIPLWVTDVYSARTRGYIEGVPVSPSVQPVAKSLDFT
jgi:hypothetical protein